MPRRDARTYPGLYFTQYLYKTGLQRPVRNLSKCKWFQCDGGSLTHMLILDECVQLRLVRHAEDHSHAAIFDHVAGVLHLLDEHAAVGWMFGSISRANRTQIASR